MNFSASLCHATDLKIQNFVENGSLLRGMETKHFGPAFLLLCTWQVYLCKTLQIIFDHLYILATETLHICVTSLWNPCFKIAKNKKERNKERRKWKKSIYCGEFQDHQLMQMIKRLCLKNRVC